MASDYHRRHYGVHKLYCGIDKEGKTSKCVHAYTKKEAEKDLRAMGFKPVKVYQT